MECAALTEACLTLNAPTRGCSSTCPQAARPFRIDAYGVAASEEVSAAINLTKFLPDPLDGFRLRHLERDLFANPRRPVRAAGAITMLWPNWEGGYGDHFMWTIIPLGFLLSQRQLPDTPIAISGALYPKLYAQLRRVRHVCTFERNDSYADVRIVNPLPRCESQCFRSISICTLPAIAHEQSWRATVTLDHLLGFPIPALSEAAVATNPGVLRVLFARRKSWHGRVLLNVDELVNGCAASRVLGWRLRCRGQELGSMPVATMVQLLRHTDVFVSMHGADVINGMHMMPGRAVRHHPPCARPLSFPRFLRTLPTRSEGRCCRRDRTRRCSKLSTSASTLRKTRRRSTFSVASSGISLRASFTSGSCFQTRRRAGGFPPSRRRGTQTVHCHSISFTQRSRGSSDATRRVCSSAHHWWPAPANESHGLFHNSLRTQRRHGGVKA